MVKRKSIRRHVRTRLGGKKSTWFHVNKQSKDAQNGGEASASVRRKRECNDIEDSKTTYVRKKIYKPDKNDWFYPKYVDCDYVE